MSKSTLSLISRDSSPRKYYFPHGVISVTKASFKPYVRGFLFQNKNPCLPAHSGKFKTVCIFLSSHRLVKIVWALGKFSNILTICLSKIKLHLTQFHKETMSQSCYTQLVSVWIVMELIN